MRQEVLDKIAQLDEARANRAFAIAEVQRVKDEIASTLNEAVPDAKRFDALRPLQQVLMCCW